MSAHLADDGRCHLCGRPMVEGVCRHCDRLAQSWFNQAASWVRHPQGRWLGVVALVLAAIEFALFGPGLPGSSHSIRPSTGAVSTEPAPPTSSPVTRPTAAFAAPSTFEVLGAEMDIFGNRVRRGYAFVIHSSPQNSYLLTDFYMIAQAYMNGIDTVYLRRRGQEFTAKVIAVGPDCHVALLQISGTYPSLPVSPAIPKAGDTVTLGEATSGTKKQAALVAYSDAAGTSHLTLSLEVSSVDDGLPVLDTAGRVVGIAEPTMLYRVGGVGFAVPMLQACQAVGAC